MKFRFLNQNMFVLAIVFSLCVNAISSETGTVFLSFSEINTDSLTAFPLSEKGNPPAENYERLAVGIFNDVSFSIVDVSQIIVSDSSGQTVPVYVDENGIIKEFDRIVSLRMALPIDAKDKQPDNLTYKISWSPLFSNKNVHVINNWSLGTNFISRYLLFQWSSFIPGVQQGQVASIEVIADSKANYYSLWYLLPMALIFLFLTVRKFVKKPDSESDA